MRMYNARDKKPLTQCLDRCSRSRSQCHRVVLDSCQLSFGQCGMSTHHGRPRGSFWSTGDVSGLRRRLHRREHRLCNGSLSCHDARWSHHSGHRWRGVISVNLIILSDFVPLRQRSKYQGLIQLVFALGTNIAPIIGGAMVDSSWRWYDHPKRSLLSLASANACEGYSTSTFRSVQSAW